MICVSEGDRFRSTRVEPRSILRLFVMKRRSFFILKYTILKNLNKSEIGEKYGK